MLNGILAQRASAELRLARIHGGVVTFRERLELRAFMFHFIVPVTVMDDERDQKFKVYEHPKYPIGSIVIVEDPTHDHWDITKNIPGFIYEAFLYGNNMEKMYTVLIQKHKDCYDMKHCKLSTINRTKLS